MPIYLHPGVYIEEQPAPQTIEGVSTSTAGFVGATQKGPTEGLPQLITSFPDFLRVYGGYLPEDPWKDTRYLAYAVEGFFNNGGQRVYIKRVVGESATAASLTLNDGFVTRLLEDTASERAARNTVRLASLRGISQGSQLTFRETIAGNEQSQTLTVTAYNSSTNSVTLNASLDLRYTNAGCRVNLFGVSDAPEPRNGNPSLTIRASSEGSWGQEIRVSVTDVNGAVGLAEATGVQTTLRAIDLEFGTGGGPGAGATNVELNPTSFSALEDNDDLEFQNASGDTERRTITKGTGNTITWSGTDNGALTNDYSNSGSSVRRLTAIRRSIPLAFDTSGPASGATSVSVNAASFARLSDNDVVEFANSTGDTEQRAIIKASTGTTISWTDPLTSNYSSAGSTIHLIFSSVVAPVSDTTGFQAGDLIQLNHGTQSQVAQIAAGGVDATNRQITLETSTYAITRNYEAADLLILATAGRSASTRLDLRSTRNFYSHAVIEIDDETTKTYHTVSSIDGRSLVLTNNLGRDVASGTAVRVVEFSLSFEDGVTSELFDNLSLDEDAPNFVENIINLRSRLVQVNAEGSTRQAPFNLPRTLDGTTDNLDNGSDGDPPTADEYRGVDAGPGKRSGIKALSDIDDISIIAAPGFSDSSVQAELINQCEQLKDRFAVLDPSEGSVVGSGRDDDILVQRSNHDTLYAAVYYPWLRIRDPLYGDDPNGRLVPPSGHVIGIYARVDTERGVQKAPANEVIRGITGLEIKLSDREQDILNPKNINVIRDFRDNNRGIRVWGARCLTSDNAWKYVPVRRLFIFLEESLDEGLQWVVFEPNGEALWARVRRTITGFLRTLWLSGALAGVTEEEAFFVKCDRTTMTQDDIDNGRLIILVGAAPLKPAEFVIVRVSQKTLEASS